MTGIVQLATPKPATYFAAVEIRLMTTLPRGVLALSAAEGHCLSYDKTLLGYETYF